MAYPINDRYVRINEDELRGTEFLSRIRIVSHEPSMTSMGYDFIVDRNEYEYLLQKEVMCKMHRGMSCTSDTRCGVYSGVYKNSFPEQKPIEPPKEKKASKQIRHQFLRKRLLERLKK